jgi:hypothetical protein
MVRIWNSVEGEWLEPMSLLFDSDNNLYLVTAIRVGDDPIGDGWYTIEGDDLEKIAIIGDINHNVGLLPDGLMNKDIKILVLTNDDVYLKSRIGFINHLNISYYDFDYNLVEYQKSDLVYYKNGYRVIVMKSRVENYKEIIREREPDVFFIDLMKR